MVNKVVLVGRLGKDPVVKHFPNDGAVAEFSLATDERYRDKDGNVQESTDWHNIKVNGKKQAEIVEKYMRKGSLIFIEGRVKYRSYDKDGVKRYITEIVVDQFKMLDKASGNNPGGQQSYSAQQNSAAVQETSADMGHSGGPEDDLPF